MNSRSQNPLYLNSRDTFERYEKHSTSPPHTHHPQYGPQFGGILPPRTTSTMEQQPAPVEGYRYRLVPSAVVVAEEQAPNEDWGRSGGGQAMLSPLEVEEGEKKKLPLGWIIGIAVAVPVFIIIVLFIAVWLQELGMI